MFSALGDVAVAERVVGEAADVIDTSCLNPLAAHSEALLMRPRSLRSLAATLVERCSSTPTALGRHASFVVESWVLMPDRSDASRPELLHRDHVLHELIDGDFGALVKATRFVLLEIRLIPVQRGEDVASAGSHALHRDD